MPKVKKNRRLTTEAKAMQAECVIKGVALLDIKYLGWYWDINPQTLDMAHGKHDILGQLHDDFAKGLSRTGLDPTFPCTDDLNHGFNTFKGGHEHLAKVWRKVIQSRKKGAA